MFQLKMQKWNVTSVHLNVARLILEENFIILNASKIVINYFGKLLDVNDMKFSPFVIIFVTPKQHDFLLVNFSQSKIINALWRLHIAATNSHSNHKWLH